MSLRVHLQAVARLFPAVESWVAVVWLREPCANASSAPVSWPKAAWVADEIPGRDWSAMSLGTTWPACETIWLGLFAVAAACSGRRSLMASAHTAALVPAAGVVVVVGVLVVVGADAVELWVTAGDGDVLVVLDFDEPPQAASDRTTVNVNGNATKRYRT